MVGVHAVQRGKILPQVDATTELTLLLLISCLLTSSEGFLLKDERTISMLSGLLPSIVCVEAEYLYVHMCERGAFLTTQIG